MITTINKNINKKISEEENLLNKKIKDNYIFLKIKIDKNDEKKLLKFFKILNLIISK